MLFENKVVLITGASNGIGRATAMAFAGEGARVAIADIIADKAHDVLKEIHSMSSEAMFVETDVSKSEAVESLIQNVIREFGRIDIAFNNAGLEGEQAPLAEMAEDNWHRVIGVNLTGVWYCMKQELNQMLKQETGGVIVNNASVAGQVGFANISAYTASKHGVLGLTRTAALEYATQKIRVNAVCPGVIHTSMIDRFTGGDKEAMAQMSKMQPMQRMGDPEEVAQAVLWLASDRASFVTGHSLVVDGGFLA